MRSTHAVLVLVLVSTALACHEQPSLAGVSLECKTDLDCSSHGEGWRCYENGCIRNTPPTIAALEPDYVALASPAAAVSKTASAIDTEGDALTFAWRALPGPAAALANFTGDRVVSGETLTVTPTAVGIYDFEVTANDGYADSVSVSYRLVVQPELDAVYVSTSGADAPGCGTVTEPCASIGFGVGVASTRTRPLVLVAAAGGGGDYAECLDVGGDVIVSGCYDAETWASLTEARDRCAVRCAKPNGTAADPEHPAVTDMAGHRLRGNATLRDLSLRLDPLVAPVLNPLTVADTGDSFGIVTLLITDGAPSVEDVDIRIADCGAGCSSVGLGSIYASPTLVGVDISGAIEGFDPMDLYIGMLFYGGTPTVLSDAGHLTRRGQVVMNLPATQAAIAVLAAVSVLTLDGISIQGGLAPTLVGVETIVGQTTLDNVDVELTGLGARTIYGVLAAGCDPAGDGPNACDCSLWYPACPATEPARPTPPALTLTNTRVRVKVPTSAGAGLRPCAGVGMQVAADAVALTVDGDSNPAADAGSQIQVGDDFTLALGMILQLTTSATLPFSVSNTGIDVGSAAVDDVCVFQAEQQGNTDFPGAAVGVAIADGAGGTLTSNRIRTGANDRISMGIAMFSPSTVTIRGNTIDVAESQGRQVAESAFGVVIAKDTATLASPSTFEENRVSIGADASFGWAVSHGGSPYWRFVNNFIHGGGAFHSIGMAVGPTTLDAAFPVFEHNTISGGHAVEGATSRALQLISPNDDAGHALPDPVLPIFSNNLLDAGKAHGRRILLDNYASKPFGPSSTGNRGQFDDITSGPRPEILIPGVSSFVSTGTAMSKISWWTLASNSSELMNIVEVNPAGTGEPNVMALSDGVALGGPVLASWANRLRLKDWLVVALPGSLALAQIDGDALPVFEPAETVTYDPITRAPVPHAPRLVAAAYANRDPLLDLLFVDDAGLWVLYRDPARGFNTPELLQATAPSARITALAVHPDGNNVIVLSGETLVWLSPADSSTGNTAPPSITLPAMPPVVKDVLPTFFGEEPALVGNDRKSTLDLVALVEVSPGVNDVLVFFNILAGGPPSRVSFSPANEPPCGVNATGFGGPYPASTPTAIWVDELVPALPDHGKELLIGCSDGRVEMFRTAGALPPYDLRRFAQPATVISPAPVTGITTNAFDTVHSRRLAVTRGSANLVTSYYIDQPTSVYVFREQLSLSLLPDAAWRSTVDGQLHVDFTAGGPPGMTLQPAAAGVPRACDFVGGMPYDLHRATNTEPLCRAARLADVLEDIDGGDRPDPADIGADEFGVP
jgi:hypothetical protein